MDRVGLVSKALRPVESGRRYDARGHEDEPLVDYNLACYYSLEGQKPLAIVHLAAAIESDPTYRDLVHDEPDFDPLRSDPNFLAITSVIV